jgi:hypothetical protein
VNSLEKDPETSILSRISSQSPFRTVAIYDESVFLFSLLSSLLKHYSHLPSSKDVKVVIHSFLPLSYQTSHTKQTEYSQWQLLTLRNLNAKGKSPTRLARHLPSSKKVPSRQMDLSLPVTIKIPRSRSSSS